MIDELEELLKAAVGDVFRTMLNFDTRCIPFGADPMDGEAHIAGSVGFIGAMTGVVYIYTTAAFARTMTSRMVGMAEPEIDGDEMVNDAVGELANMIVGSLKSNLAERGLPCVLTIPSIVRGSNFYIEAVSSATRRVACFRCDDGQNLVVEILLKPSPLPSHGTQNTHG
jgi:chemotaxis protein CheX